MDLERAAPGPLSATHAQVEALRDYEGCALCHGVNESSLRRACLACHEPIETQLAKATGLHGSIEASSDCGRCHLEHASPAVPLVTPEAFALAGIPVRDEYDHASLAFELRGVHEALRCEACHTNANVEVLAPGSVRFLGLEQACATCHASPHGASMSQNCAECHGQDTPFDVLADFEHDPIFELVGAHAGVGCYDCHENGTPYSVENSQRVKATHARTCSTCHEDDHSQSFLERVAAEAFVEPSAKCAACHSAVRNGFELAHSEMTLEHHAATGFELAVPHDDAKCTACHDPAGSFRQKYPGRAADNCAACHADPHGGQFDEPLTAARACTECHADDAFLPHLFDQASHSRTVFPLDGAHTEIACSECHVPLATGDSLVFRGTERECAACHEDVHDGNFQTAADQQADCSKCHLTTNFNTLAEGQFDHERDTRFELVGAHAKAECARCHHAPDHTPDQAMESGAAFGFVSALYPGPKDRCDTCHVDVHKGRFLIDPDTGQPSDCSACHDETAFTSSSVRAFSHGTWTAFELRGAHLRAECAACHRRTEASGSERATLGRIEDTFKGSPERCDTCHVDVHDGLMQRDPETGGPTDCSHCHSEESFAPHVADGFAHALWTGFKLEGAHQEASCQACHPASLPDANGRTFGRALGSSCADCHRDPHLGQFRLNAQNDCAQCHSGTTSFFDLSFDHNRDSEFPLDETHSKLNCAACHQTWTAGNDARAIRYKPLGRECADCHLPGTGRER